MYLWQQNWQKTQLRFAMFWRNINVQKLVDVESL